MNVGLTGRKLMEAEAWIAHRLNKPDLFAVGTSTLEQRAGILRAHLTKHDLAAAWSWESKSGNRRETWAQSFERVYGEPLHHVEHSAP